MEELSLQKIILPMVMVLLAIILVSILSVNSIQKVKQDCSEAVEELNTCHDLLTERTDNLNEAVKQLNITVEDLSKYDEIYQQTAGEAENLSEQLRKEQQQNNTVVYNVPARAVPTADAFSKAVKMELMLDRLRQAEEVYDQPYVQDKDLRLIVGELYTISWEFKNLFIEDGSRVPLGDKAQELYRENNDILNELDGFYHYFDEVSTNRMKTRVGQIITLQENVIRGMQGTYFLR